MEHKTFDDTARMRLQTLLDAHSENGSTMRCDELQGFMTALISGPDALKSGNWLPEALGDAAFSSEEQQEIEQLALLMADDMRVKLSAKTLPDLWLYNDEAGLPDFFTWCNAYLYALDVVETDWFEAANNEEFEDLFYPIMALAGIYDEDENGQTVMTISETELTQLQSELPHIVLDIYSFWQAVINKPKTVRREGGKVGRNDPCPCGSGKKAKACCGVK